MSRPAFPRIALLGFILLCVGLPLAIAIGERPFLQSLCVIPLFGLYLGVAILMSRRDEPDRYPYNALEAGGLGLLMAAPCVPVVTLSHVIGGLL